MLIHTLAIICVIHHIDGITLHYLTYIEDKSLKKNRNASRFSEHLPVRAVLMGTKSCTKILIFSTRFAIEDFVTLLTGKKSW